MSALFDKLLGKDPESRARSVQVLANLDSASSIPKLIAALGDEAVEVRRAAATALEPHGRTGDASAIVALTKALDDKDTEVRKSAAISLGSFVLVSTRSIENAQAKEALVKLLEKDGNMGVLNNVVLALAQIQDPAMIKSIVDAFRPKDKKVIGMAIDAIDNLPSTDIRLEMKNGLRSIL